jgi:hypothetical protein
LVGTLTQGGARGDSGPELLPSLALIGIQSTLVRTEYLSAVVVAFLSFLLLFSFFVEAVNSVENV